MYGFMAAGKQERSLFAYNVRDGRLPWDVQTVCGAWDTGSSMSFERRVRLHTHILQYEACMTRTVERERRHKSETHKRETPSERDAIKDGPANTDAQLLP